MARKSQSKKPARRRAPPARGKQAPAVTAPANVPRAHGRFDYSPLIDRPNLTWPNGARVALWVIPNIEHFLFDRTAARISGGPVAPSPDVMNYSWRDYGVRVGIWRMMEVMERHGVRGTVALNSDVCSEYPRIIEEGKKLGWEWMGHGITNSIRIGDQSEAEQRELVRDSVTIIGKSVGKKPRGWLSPGLTETVNTLDYLAENGIEYVGNWVNDEQPYPMKVKTGSMISMPYSAETERHSGAAQPAPQPGAVRTDDLRSVRRAVRGRGKDRPGDVDLPASVPDRAPAPEQVFRQGAGAHHLAAGGVARDRQRDRRLVQEELFEGVGSGDSAT